MRTLHLATSLSGGAGIAARRICEAQVSQGMNSQIIGGQVNSSSILQSHESVYRGNMKSTFKSKLTTALQRYTVQNSNNLITSLTTSTINIKEIDKDFDLVHIHANYNFVDLDDIVELSNRVPIVITLHDQRFFTGGCHYSFECDGFIGDCKECPQVRSIFDVIPEKSLKKSINAFEKMRNLEAIAPSKWLADLALKSRVLGKNKVWTVANPVPDVFKPRQTLSAVTGSLKIGFISQDLNNPYKGLDVLLQAASEIEKQIPIELRLFGRGKISTKLLNSQVIFSQFENEEQASIAYNSCDLVVVPSRQDNFPSVVTEALSCGVPVIGSNIGGIREVLDDFGLPTFQSGDAAALAKLVLGFSALEIKRDYAIQAAANFSFKESAQKHNVIYAKLVK